jgi:sugar/nucleoside kinase (ribokinase family)
VAILVYGALNPDLVHHVDRIPQAGEDLRSRSWRLTWGGKVANAGLALASWGATVRLSGLVLGEDALAEALLALIARPGVDLSAIEQDAEERTRHCVVFVTPDGDRTIVCTGYEDARWSNLAEEAWVGVEVVVLDSFCADAGRVVADEAHRRKLPVVWIDPDPADTRLATVAVWSAAERSGGEAERSKASITVLTSAGAPIGVWVGGRSFTVTPPRVDVTDATGAGDAVAAGCALGLVEAWSVERMVAWAAAAGAAMAAAGRGASLPSRADVEALLD